MAGMVDYNRSFLLAASRGDIPKMEECLTKSKGACANAIDEHWSVAQEARVFSMRGGTAFHFALRVPDAGLRDSSIVFLSKKCSGVINHKDANKETVLF